MTKTQEDRRATEWNSLDIDRRKSDSRRDENRRPWLSQAYEEIYITSYINAIYPRFPTRVHAFSNLDGDNELSSVEWIIADLGAEDAAAKKPLRPLQSFALHLIQQGLVVDESGKVVMTTSTPKTESIDHFLLRVVG